MVAAAGGLAVGLQTRGLRAFTADAARRLDVVRAPRPVPPVAVVDQMGRVGPLLVRDGRICVVDFIYMSCPTLCVELGEQFQQLQAAIQRRALSRRVGLCSISFDLDRDHVPELADYAARHRADPRLWRIVRPLREDGLVRVLDVFDVVVLPDGFGGFVHNAALHVVDAQAHLIDIVATVDAALAHAEGLAA